MKQTIAILAFMASILAVSGCYRDALITELPKSQDPQYEKWRNHFLYGVVRGIRTEDVQLAEVCPQGVARAETKMNGWNGLVSVLTIGIYTPMKLNIYCATTAVPIVHPPADMIVE